MTRKVHIRDLPSDKDVFMKARREQEELVRTAVDKAKQQQQTLGSGPNTRQEELEARFREFHDKYPYVFDWFCDFAHDMLEVCDHYSAYGIMHMVRYQALARPLGGSNPLRHPFRTNNRYLSISNDLVPYYSRLAMETDPRLEGFFTIRHLTTEDKRPHNFGGEA